MTEETLLKIKDDYNIIKKLYETKLKNSNPKEFEEICGSNKSQIMNRIFNQYKDEIDEDNSVNIFVYMGVYYANHNLNEIRLIFDNLETSESVRISPSELDDFTKCVTVIYPKEILSEDIGESASAFDNVRAEFLEKAAKEGQNSAKKYMYEMYGESDIKIF